MRIAMLALMIVVLATPLAVLAQPAKKVPRIGLAVVGTSGCKLGTAKAIGIAIPPSVLLQATRLIE